MHCWHSSASGTTNDGGRAHHHAADYIHRALSWSPEFIGARRQSVSLPHDYTPDLARIQAPVLLIDGRYDRMVPFEVSIAILNHIADWHLVLLNCGHWPPFEKPAECPRRRKARSCSWPVRRGCG
jgi:pimeloyl-ACP methyl ester carboxylesterase